jgi:hypothetical protein
MNIAKALKTKNRFAGEISKLQEIFRRENSKRSDNTSSVDAQKVYADLLLQLDRITRLKGSISRASAPIAEKLVRLSELKGIINWLQGVPYKEGEEKASYGTKEVYTYEWKAFLNREKLDEQVDLFQVEINQLQDEIDDFNAKTQIDFTE